MPIVVILLFTRFDKVKSINLTKVIVKNDENNFVKEMLIKNSKSDEMLQISLNIYLMKKDLLVKMIELGYEQGHMDFERHTLQQNIDKLKIYAYLHNGYSAIIDDIQSYYGENMKMLNSKVRNDLFYRAGKIYTKTKVKLSYLLL